VKLYTNLEKRL